MKAPLFSVVIANYNHDLYISECIGTVMHQTFEDFECIIVDDGSTDKSVSTVLALIVGDTRFRLMTQENSGVANARNTGIRAAIGEYIVFLDSDDLLGIDYLKEANKTIVNNPDFYLYYSGAEFIGNKKGKWSLPSYDYRKMLLGSNMIYLTTVTSRENVLRVGCFNEKMTEGWEDWEFYIRLLHGVNARQIIKNDKCLFYYRIKNFSRSVTIDTSKDVRNRMMNTCFLANLSIYLEYYPNPIDSFMTLEYFTNLSRTKLFKFFFRFKFFFGK